MRDHFETFRARAAGLRDGEGLPAFVEHAFRQFLRCGFLAGGFARFRCDRCGADRLVPFSCKDRALCPSCGGRRMAERAAHLRDRVFPDVPVRQWVLSLPYRLRYLMAWDHDLCRAAAAIFMSATFRVLRERARDSRVDGGRGGAVVVIQRFGGALNLNVHFHALVLDGVFGQDEGGRPVFHRTRGLTSLDVAEVLAAIDSRLRRLLRRRGLAGCSGEGEPRDGWADETPVLAGFAAAAVQGTTVRAPRRGARPRRLVEAGDPDDAATPVRELARANGFSLHAGLVVPAGQRDRLERVCRYVLRPPVAAGRIEVLGSGDVRVALRRPWADGTTAIVFDPIAFLERLAVLVPRPRINLILYYGVLGARSAWRGGVVGEGRPEGGEAMRGPGAGAAAGEARRICWAALMARTFGLDVLACARCGGRLRLIALVEDAAVVRRVLAHLGLPTDIPAPRAARAPPGSSEPLDGYE